MAQYFQTAAVVLLSVLGIIAGCKFSRLRSPYWAVGYGLPAVVVFVIMLVRWTDGLCFVTPFSWIMAGRREFVAFSPACTILLTTVLSRLTRKSQRVMVGLFMGTAVVYYSVLPFLLPAVLRGRLLSLPSIFDSEGVCLQNTAYTCGPAAAVTALRQLGIKAQEGELAVLACTNPVIGTPPDLLCSAIEKHYESEGLQCEYRYFESTSELANESVTIVAVSFSFMIDHYVTVLEVTDGEVIVGDPNHGMRSLSREEFEGIWRYDGIVLRRSSEHECARMVAN